MAQLAVTLDVLIDEECMTGAQHISGEQVQCAG